MSGHSHEVSAGGEVRLVPLSQVGPRAGFNPRRRRDPDRFAQLVASVKADGLLQPLLVTPDGNGGYHLVAGEGRYLAAGEAGQTEVPVYVRSVDQRTGGLELAMAENLARQDLDLVEEAHGFQRLRDAGLTKKGIAERLGIAQKRVTDRLEVLKVPDALYPGLASGAVPPAAVKPLVRLAKIHPGLPEVLAARVEAPPAQSWSEPLSWADVVHDPIAALIADFDGDQVGLPRDVFDAAESYPLDRFALSDETRGQLDELCALLDMPIERFEVRFGREALEHATHLGAAHGSSENWHHLIVGQDVADQLAGDYIATCLKVQCDTNERIAEAQAARENSEVDDGDDASGAVAPEPSEEQRKAQRRDEREAQLQARREAEAFNAELGAAVLRHLARLKVDADVLKVITAVDVAGDLAGLSARGARYGFPGWPQTSQQKNGKTKVEYLPKEQAAAKARAFLEQAATVAEIAGRLVCLIAMARYANEADAVANTNRSFYELRVPAGLPYSDEVVDLVDRIAGERLPEHLTATVRERRATQRADHQRAEHERTDALARLDRIEDRAGELDDAEREQAIADIETVHGRYSTEAWRLTSLLRDGRPADPEPTDDKAEPTADDDATPVVAPVDADGETADARARPRRRWRPEPHRRGGGPHRSLPRPVLNLTNSLVKEVVSVASARLRLTDDEREQQRAQDRERLKEAAEQLLTSEGWQRWVRVRAQGGLARLSLNNQLLVALSRPDATFVAGFKAWLKLGYCVRKGEKAIRIVAPMPIKEREGETNGDESETRVLFKGVSVFDRSQVAVLESGTPTPLEPPCELLTGDSHAHLLEPLVAFAGTLGYSVSFEAIAGPAGGWCDAKAKRIVVDADTPPNARLRTLIHETVHALGVGYAEYGRERAEVIVDTVTFIAASSVGLDVAGESVPYVAGWGEDGALEAVTEFAKTIDELARRIETALETNDAEDVSETRAAA